MPKSLFCKVLYRHILAINTSNLKIYENDDESIIIEFTQPKEQIALDIKRILEATDQETYSITEIVDYRTTVWRKTPPPKREITPFDICKTEWYNEKIPQRQRFNQTPQTIQSHVMITDRNREYIISFLKQYLTEKI